MVAGGLIIGLCNDFIVINENSNHEISMKETRIGIPIPSIPLIIIESEINYPNPYKDIILSGRNLAPKEAVQMGLVTHSVQDQESLLQK
jgi:enoyl-CoA hydratase/carnithine racemase